MTMDARKQRVLQAIVALYGLEGEPVGSSVLANYFDMAVSSATLRNEMAALTKLGLHQRGPCPQCQRLPLLSRQSADGRPAAGPRDPRPRRSRFRQPRS